MWLFNSYELEQDAWFGILLLRNIQLEHSKVNERSN